MHLRVGLSVIPWFVNYCYSRWVAASYPFAAVGRNLQLHYSVDLNRHMSHRIAIGDSVEMDRSAWVYVSPAAPEGDEPALIIGDNCFIARYSQVAARNRIELERDVMLSANALIVDHLHAYEDVSQPIRRQGITEGGKIRIGQGCWIGHGAAIVCDRGELELGRNCVVAANAVVTKSFPANSVIAGNPARIVRQFDAARHGWVLGVARSGVPVPEMVEALR